MTKKQSQRPIKSKTPQSSGADMPRGRIKGDHDAKRTEIAEVACRVFLKLGLAHTSLADISREMGYTTGVLRHYFADKDSLLLFAKNLLWDRAYEMVRFAAEREQGIEKLRAMATQLLPGSPEAIDRYRLLAMFNGSAIGDSRLMKLQSKRNDHHAELFAEAIASLQKDGLLRAALDPRIEAAAIIALNDGLAEQVIMSPGIWSRDDLTGLANRHIDSLLNSRRITHRATR
jgi:AcrR family transcriptional regulator